MPRTRAFILTVFTATVLAFSVAACTPLTMPLAEHVPASDLPSGPAIELQAETTLSAPDDDAEDVVPAVVDNSVDGALATIVIRSLRVRRLPDDSSAVVAGVNEGDIYPVLEISDDGFWVRLAIDGLRGGGWVSSNFVSVEGVLPAESESVDSEAVAERATFSLIPTATPRGQPSSTIEATEAADSLLQPTATPVATETPTATLIPTATLVPTATRLVLVIVPTPAPGYATVVTGGSARLRVRGAPATDAEIVGYAFNGQAYRILEISPEGTWFKVEGAADGAVSGVTDGWLSAQFLIVGQ